MPIVSIITPSWNVESLIGKTIESVLAQTFGDWELLIADDCSKDNTAAVIEGYARKDPRVRLIRQPRNRGPALARQAALEQASGSLHRFFSTATISGCPPSLSGRLALPASAGRR